MDKSVYDQRQIEILTQDICACIEDEGWAPEIVVGVSRGGLIPGVMISHYFDVPFQPVQASFRDHTKSEKSGVDIKPDYLMERLDSGASILLVDDICDSGVTLDHILNEWKAAMWTDLDLGGKVRVATLHFRKGCEFEVDYIGEFIEDDTWIEYPWESWWK